MLTYNIYKLNPTKAVIGVYLKIKQNLLILTILLLILIPYFQTTTEIITAENYGYPESPGNVITVDAPISITSDAELISLNLPGSGTYNDPYRIEYLNIALSSGQTGIYITGLVGSNSYIMIRNCTITGGSYGIDVDNILPQRARVWNSTISNDDIAIRMTDTNNTEAMNNTITNCGTAGIRFDNCSESFVYNNTITDCYRAIYVTNCIHMFIYYNDVSACVPYGILAEDSDETVIQYNVITSCDRGIESYSTIDPYIGHNQVNDCSNYGILIRYSDYARVISNNFHACGLGVYDINEDDLLTLQVINNYIDSSMIRYEENLTDTDILTASSQYILVNCSNVQISSQNSFATSLYSAINLHFCTNIDIRFCNISYNHYAINFFYSNNIKIYNNTLYHNVEDIAATGSDEGFIRNNRFYDGQYGIHFINSVTNFDIYQNAFQKFSYGIVFELCTGNRIYHNTLLQCTSTSYGYDDTGNTWYNTTLNQGNYWQNWNGTGTYAIDGAAGVFDMYPLSDPYVPPVISEYVFISWFAVVFLTIIPGLVIYLKKRK